MEVMDESFGYIAPYSPKWLRGIAFDPAVRLMSILVETGGVSSVVV